jgi:hypothetical protein
MAGGRPSPEELGWVAARLFSTSGIRGADEQERRAASALLAVMAAVPSFGRALIHDLSAPKGHISTYAETPFGLGDGKTCRPDGVIVTKRGSNEWRCLVEVKTGSGRIGGDQVNMYLDVARLHGFDGLLTVSNQIPGSARDLPFDVDRRRLRRVELRHLSWWQIVTAAVLLHRHRGVSDPDQAWILGELIEYLNHENSGATGFRDMGRAWSTVLGQAARDALRPNDSEVTAVCERWQQLVFFLCLGLTQELGRPVEPVRSKGRSAERLNEMSRSLASEGKLRTTIRVPDAIAPIDVEADLRVKSLSVGVMVDAPQDRRPLARINWLLRQLRDAPGDLEVETSFVNTRTTTGSTLSEAIENPRALLAADPQRQPRSFRVTWTRPMGTRRGRGSDSVVHETRQQLATFYRDLVQGLKPWQPRPPKLPQQETDPVLMTAAEDAFEAEGQAPVPPPSLTPMPHAPTEPFRLDSGGQL